MKQVNSQVGTAVVFGAMTIAHFAQAQIFTTTAPTPNIVTVRAAHPLDTVREIKIRNVAVSAMAHWIDPQNTPKSFVDKASFSSWVASGYDEKEAPRLRPVIDITLPEGVYLTQYSNEKNSVTIAGSQEGVQRAENLIRQIDQPLEQVEVNAQLFLIDNATLQAAHLPFMPEGKTLAGRPMQQAKVEEKTATFLRNKWQGDKNIKIVTAPRVVAIDGLAARLSFMTITTSGFDYIIGKEKYSFNFNTAGMKNIPGLAEAFGMTVVPTVQSEGSIKALVQISRNYSLDFSKSFPLSGISLQNALNLPGSKPDFRFLGYGDGVEKTLTFKGGETFAFTGFDTDAFLGKANSKDEMRQRRGKTLVAFVTMERIRRHDEIAALPAK